MCSLATVAGVAKRSSKEAYINTPQFKSGQLLFSYVLVWCMET